MSGINEVQNKLINDIAHQRGFKDFQIYVDSGSDKGDNYMGIITTVKVIEGKKTLQLVLKTSHTDEKFRENMKISMIYDRELYVYEKIFPLFEKLQKELPLKHPFKAHTECVASHVGSNFECFFMEDIRSKGFQMWNRKIPMNVGHLEAVFREYAKLHSVGMIMKNNDSELFEKITDRMFDIWKNENMSEQDMENMRSFTESMANKILNLVGNNPQVKDVVESFRTGLYEYYQNYVYNHKFALTITHGDCWCNNMMFKYKSTEDKTQPDEICLLDWQISKVGSPALDLVYFLFASADIEQVKNYRHYLKIYYEIVAENLSSVGLDPEKVFSFSMLEEHFKTFSLYGLVMCTIVLQIIMMDKDEAPDITNLNNDFESMLNLQSSNQAEYSKRMTNLVLFLADNDFIITNKI